tara:strand:- start:395 stop:3028 length:2634 start_codon:yes stop_codon:yes gene_type:complete
MIYQALSQLGYKQQEILPLLQPQQQQSMDINELFKMQQELPQSQSGIQLPGNPDYGGDFRNSDLKRFINSVYNKDGNPQNFVEDFRREDQPLSSINTVPGALESIAKGFKQMGLGLNIGKKNRFINKQIDKFRDDPTGYRLDNTFIGYDPTTGFNAMMANPEFMTPEQKEYFINRGKKVKDLNITYASLPDGKATLTSPDLAMMSAEGRGPVNFDAFIKPKSAGNPAYEHGSDAGLSDEEIKEKNEINAVSSDDVGSTNDLSSNVNPEDSKKRLYDLKEFVKNNKPDQSGINPISGKGGSGRPLLDQNEKYSNTPKSKRDYGSDKYIKQRRLNVEQYTDLVDRYRREIFPEVGLPLIQAMFDIESGGNITASSGAAGGLGQVVGNTWDQRNEDRRKAGLKEYDYNTYKYDPDVNIPYAIMTLKSKAEKLGISPDNPNFLKVVVPAYNAGENLIKKALKYAKEAGSKDPTNDWYKEEYLLKAVADFNTWNYYYKNKIGRKRNKFIDKTTGKPIPGKDKEAIEEAQRLKYKEISGYVPKVEKALPYYEKYYSLEGGEMSLPKYQTAGSFDDPESILTDEEFLEKYDLMPKVTTPPDGAFSDPSQLQSNKQIQAVDSPTGMYPGDLFFDYMTNIGQYNTPIDIALDPTVQISKRTPFGPEEADYEDLETEATMQDLQQNIGSYMDFADDLEQSNLYTKMGRQPSTGSDIPTQKIQKPKEFDLRRFAAFSEGLVNTAAGINTLFDFGNQARDKAGLYEQSMADNMFVLDQQPSRGFGDVNSALDQIDFKASNFPRYNAAQTVKHGAEILDNNDYTSMYNNVTPNYSSMNLSPKDKKILGQQMNNMFSAVRRLKRRQGGMIANVDSEMIAKLIAAGAKIEML